MEIKNKIKETIDILKQKGKLGNKLVRRLDDMVRHIDLDLPILMNPGGIGENGNKAKRQKFMNDLIKEKQQKKKQLKFGKRAYYQIEG